MATGIAQSERQALCSLLEDKGPLAPTLCEGWTTADLAAHLFVRERRPLAASGILIKPLAGITEKAMDQAKRSLGYPALINRIRSGPPLPFSLLDEQVNTAEYFIHHEDVRRADDTAKPRTDAKLDAALWPIVKRMAKPLARKVRVTGVDLVAPGFATVHARPGEPVATITGGPQELLLFLFGRQGAADVTVTGDPSAVAAVEGAPLGL